MAKDFLSFYVWWGHVIFFFLILNLKNTLTVDPPQLLQFWN